MSETAVTVLETQAKSILVSRTFWANVVVTPAAIWLASHSVVLDAQTQSEIVILAIGLMNLVLRKLSTVPVTFTLPGKTPSPPVLVPPVVGVLLLVLLGVSACTSAQVQTATLMGTPVAQAALVGYQLKMGTKADPTVVKIANDVITALPALEGAYSSASTPKAQAIAVALAAVQQVLADDKSPAVQQAGPLVIAGLTAAQTGQGTTTQQIEAAGSMIASYLLDMELAKLSAAPSVQS